MEQDAQLVHRYCRQLRSRHPELRRAAISFLRENAALVCQQEESEVRRVAVGLARRLRDRELSTLASEAITVLAGQSQAVWQPLLRYLGRLQKWTPALLAPFCGVAAGSVLVSDEYTLWIGLWRECKRRLASRDELLGPTLGLLRHVLKNLSPAECPAVEVQTALYELIKKLPALVPHSVPSWHTRQWLWECLRITRYNTISFVDYAKVGFTRTEDVVPFLVRDLQNQLPVYQECFNSVCEDEDLKKAVHSAIEQELQCVCSLIQWYIGVESFFPRREVLTGLIETCVELSRISRDSANTYDIHADVLLSDETEYCQTSLRDIVCHYVIAWIDHDDRKPMEDVLLGTLDRAWEENDYSLVEAVLRILCTIDDECLEVSASDFFDRIEAEIESMISAEKADEFTIEKWLLLFRLVYSLHWCVMRDETLETRAVEWVKTFSRSLTRDISSPIARLGFLRLFDALQDGFSRFNLDLPLQDCVLVSIYQLTQNAAADADHDFFLRTVEFIEKVQPIPSQFINEVLGLVVSIGPNNDAELLKLKKICFDTLLDSLFDGRPVDWDKVLDSLVYTSIQLFGENDAATSSLWLYLLNKYAERILGSSQKLETQTTSQHFKMMPQYFSRLFGLICRAVVETNDTDASSIVQMLIVDNPQNAHLFAADFLWAVFEKLKKDQCKASVAIWILGQETGEFYEFLMGWAIAALFKDTSCTLIDLDVLLADLILKNPSRSLEMMETTERSHTPICYLLSRWYRSLEDTRTANERRDEPEDEDPDGRQNAHVILEVAYVPLESLESLARALDALLQLNSHFMSTVSAELQLMPPDAMVMGILTRMWKVGSRIKPTLMPILSHFQNEQRARYEAMLPYLESEGLLHYPIRL